MNRRQRLMATLRCEPVDRPAVSFYEIGGLKMDPCDPDPFNVYNDPSWQPLLELAEEHTDLIRMRSPVRAHSHHAWETSSGSSVPSLRDELMQTREYMENGCRITRTTINAGPTTLTSQTRRDPNIDTLWTTEHLLKNNDDVKAYLQLPDDFFTEQINIAALEQEEQQLGDRGIVMVDTEDPICAVATLFSMEDFTIFALTENRLCHQLLEKCARYIHPRTERIAREFPGRLWRIYGPEFATEPYLPPRLFHEYVVRYTSPMVKMIQKHGGFARIHAHGRIRNVLDYIVEMGADAIDPIEPPPQGDVNLDFVRKKYGKNLILFGNLEISDIEVSESAEVDVTNTKTKDFAKIVEKSLCDGTVGQGRGFVLMPSASPYGRKISVQTLRNYETMVRLASEFTL
jgi:hypothetical protein